MDQSDTSLPSSQMGSAPIASAPQPIMIQPPPPATLFGRFGKWLLAALVLAVITCVGMYGRYQSYFSPADQPQEKYHSLSKTARPKLAIIEVSGAIMDGEGSFAKKQIDRVREDDDVVGVVLRIDSPGGTVTGSDYLYHHLRELTEDRNLPLVVSMGSMCASGGYYIAMAVGEKPDSIFSEPTTWTGSIGVIIPHYDLSGSLKMFQVKDDSIVSGPLKGMGSPTKPMTEEERNVLQALVDESFSGFKKIVVSGRPKFKDDAAALDAAATGQVFTAEQAVERGLVDKIGFIEAAIERAAELANVNMDEVRCVKYEEPPTLLGSLLGVDSAVPARSLAEVRSVLDLMAPRAYYLWTWLPAAVSSSRR
ncbi:MAG: signal peptide peptidase SppA [Planctomycetes bacterium]|nr:signal peptide peptidase SppA [Planctomycetota bacterium]